jgi:hypothetical protein
MYRNYPPTDYTRCGCKVGWRTYDTLEDAEKCAEAARWNARIKEDLGYDFGYCAPGSITKVSDGSGYEVCIP